MIELPHYTRADLRRHRGQSGARVLIAFRGFVYDVSSSFLWQRGRHQALHDAGMDLTESIHLAPHSPELLEKFPIVGILVD